MKVLKSVPFFLAAVVLTVSLFSITAFADGSSISLSSSKVNVGDNVTVTVSFSSSYDIVTSAATISYDASVLEYKSSSDACSGGSGVLKMAHVGNSQSFVFTAVKAGSCSFKTYDCSVSDGDEEYSVSGASASLNAVDVKLSDNADLKSLSISAGTLNPGFSKDVTSYDITIDGSVEELTVGAVADDSAATVAVSGSKKMKVGKNTRVIKVTAPSGAVKSYTLNITKLDNVVSPSENTSSGNALTDDADISPEVLVNDKTLFISTIDDSISINGLTKSKYNYKSTSVDALSDETGNIIVVNLIDENGVSAGLYRYDASKDSFIEFMCFTNSAEVYMMCEPKDGIAVPAGFEKATMEIDGKEISVYMNSEHPEFVFVYASRISDEPALYIYDTEEKTFQRYFDINGLGINANAQAENKGNFIKRILSNNTFRMILIAVIAIVAVVVTVLIIVFWKKSKVPVESSDEDILNFDFDDKQD